MRTNSKFKKLATVLVASVMVVAPVAGATQLNSLPGMLLDNKKPNYYCVVGEDADTRDVAGSIEVCAAAAQRAVETKETTVSGTTEEIDGLNLDSTPIRGTLSTSTAADKSDYSKLLRKTVTDEDDTDHYIYEKMDLNGVNLDTNETELETLIDTGDITYSAHFVPGFEVNDTLQMLGHKYEVTAIDNSNNEVKLGSTMSETGLAVGDSYTHGPYTVKVVDKNEDSNQIYVSVSKNGGKLDSKGLESGDKISVSDGNFEVKADSVFFGASGDYIDLTSTYTDTVVTQGEESPFDTAYGVKTVTTDTSGSTDKVTDIVLENNVAAIENPDADDAKEVKYLSKGDYFEGPQDYFRLTSMGLTSEETGTVNVEKDAKVTYTDANTMEHTIEMTKTDLDTTYHDLSADTIIPLNDIPLKVNSYSTAVKDDTHANVTVEVEYKAYSKTIDLNKITGAGNLGSDTTTDYYYSPTYSTGYGQSFQLVVELAGTDTDAGVDAVNGVKIANTGTTDTSSDTASVTAINDNIETDLGATIVSPDVDGTGSTLTDGLDNSDTLSVSGPASSEQVVTVEFNSDGEIDTESGTGVDEQVDIGGSVTLEEGEKYLTDAGSIVDFASTSQVTLTLTEKQRYPKHAFGSVTTTGTEGETVTKYVGTNFITAGKVAKLPSDIDTGAVDKPVILVGGPNANGLVEDLASQGKTMNGSEWTKMENGSYTHKNEAIVQTVEDAFNGQPALIIAGFGKQDTFKASQALANELATESGISGVPFASSELGTTKITLDTSGATTYSDLTIK